MVCVCRAQSAMKIDGLYIDFAVFFRIFVDRYPSLKLVNYTCDYRCDICGMC